MKFLAIALVLSFPTLDTIPGLPTEEIPVDLPGSICKWIRDELGIKMICD